MFCVLQIHWKEGGDICLYSRNAENLTDKYPDLVVALPNVIHPKVKTCILDCEIVAFDVASEKILPFQILSTRKRKNVLVDDVQVKVVIYAFDLLYLNGQVGNRKA